jgi:beta-lactamase regulating signal transducer with metallopeptidase domain
MINYFWNILSSYNSFELLALLALAAAKATVLLGFVALLCLAFRRFSAATRHLLWTSVLCASLLLPFLSFVKIWEVPILPAPVSVLNASGSNELIVKDGVFETPQLQTPQDLSISFEASDSAPKKSEIQTNAESFAYFDLNPNVSESVLPPMQKNAASLLPQLFNWALAVWVAGVLLLLLRLSFGFAATNLLARRAARFKETKLNELFSSLLTEFNLKNSVRLLRSEHTLMPIVCGILRPAVLLPAGAENWSEERQRIVLLHELTHVGRRDCLTQMLAQAACAFYWFNPLVWFAARRLRVEREQACDDYVLSIGTKPSEYAHHLLEIARSMQERSVFDWSQTTSVAMARQSQLEGRLLAILSQENKSIAVSRPVTLGLVALICFLLVSLAVIRPTVINAQKAQSLETSSNYLEDKIEKSLPDSFLAIGSEQGNNTVVQDSETDEATGKQKSANAPIDNLQERTLINEQIYENVEQNIKPDIESNVKQNISETVEQQIKSIVQTAEIVPSPSPENNPFIKAGYQPEPKRQTQDKPGDFIDEMASVGFANLSVDELITLKTYGVTADFVKGLRAIGFNNLTPKTVVNLRIYKVTPAYIEAMTSVGYKSLTLKELTNARIYNVTPEFIKKIQDAGYPALTIGQLIEFRIYKITPEFVRLARSRLGELTTKQIVSLKIAGVINENKDKDKK